jgi:tyrosine-specific transport protein
MTEKHGSVIGGILLIAGSCIGAGMLALPILTGLAGFFPSLIMFLSAWAFMTLTGLLLVEVNGWFDRRVNLITMAGHTFGRFGKMLSWVLYLFLFYALLVAYVSGSGSLFSSYFKSAFSYELPDCMGSLFFVLLFGYIVYLGTRTVDHWNRVLMFGKIAAFLGLVFLGARHIKTDFLLYSNSSYAIFSLPLLITSFGFHNMIPSLMSYMKNDIKRVRLTILGGSFFVLFLYLIWEILVLGIVPVEGKSGIIESLKQDQEASQAIAGILGSSWVSNFASALAFFAILTSFLAQALSLVHFLSDGFKISHGQRENMGLCALALIPPLALSILYPQLFFKALNFAGGVCAVILFGVLPVGMVWKGRYKKEMSASYTVPGGKVLLCVIFLFALFVLFFQLSSMFGAPYILKP